MRRTAALLAALALALGASLIATTPAYAAPARANGQSNPVIFIHGYSSTNCSTYWSKASSLFSSTGWTGARVTYGYYTDDSSCSHEYAGSLNSSIKTIGKDLANWIYTTYSKNGVKVDVVAHSMGGLIIRSALTEVAKKTAGWPAYLYVEDVVTLGTPHDGAIVAGGLCIFVNNTQCSEMSAGSTFLQGLTARPESAMQTDWTNIGSYADEIVTAASATYMNGQHKIQYQLAAGLQHAELITASTGTYSSRFSHNGAAWSAYAARVNPVQWARNAVYYSSST
ncbi:triacylglycerol esterase/lipase EstA (alpha/beta hydrolase family) [Allocatelliglobosispora scoriae]|uniref:Triacylglycerol esterase/lipase EstA (Alpha/beta hydrolase family) n=1 Tax=Allocatelliglobosispora scoriae TaxID=643052 RepID=A0A841C3Q8_9ACTN|nr:alpha/beta hydrolase [Allocatelliglobosispora scoriae]MBB5873600.1 triacylglycerol esterase/lipase EstA (alpha/beta hydrolase family) [Allocatelliglobosispora scoriae]